jgi:hypothetical protein
MEFAEPLFCEVEPADSKVPCHIHLSNDLLVFKMKPCLFTRNVQLKRNRGCDWSSGGLSDLLRPLLMRLPFTWPDHVCPGVGAALRKRARARVPGKVGVSAAIPCCSLSVPLAPQAFKTYRSLTSSGHPSALTHGFSCIPPWGSCDSVAPISEG